MWGKVKKEETPMYSVIYKRGDYYVTVENKCYAFDIKAIEKLCLKSSGEKDIENEITETYEKDDEGLTLNGKIVREIKTNGNPQNDMITYDFVKLFIMRLLDNASFVNETFQMDFSTSLALNTLIKWKLLVEVE
jgi:hypothetical protein